MIINGSIPGDPQEVAKAMARNSQTEEAPQTEEQTAENTPQQEAEEKKKPARKQTRKSAKKAEAELFNEKAE